MFVAESLGHGKLIARLRSLRNRHPWLPVVVVTRGLADNARLLADLTVDEVVWLRDVDEELASAIRRAEGQAVLARLAAAVEASGRATLFLRGALIEVFRSRRPIRSVNELARRVGSSRITLWREWRGCVPSVRLLELLAWVVLVRAASYKAPGQPWRTVAAALEVDEKTLARWSRGICGVTLRELARDPLALSRSPTIAAVVERVVDQDAETFWGEMKRIAVDAA